MKLNQRGEGNGRQSSSIVFRAIGLMALGLFALLAFSSPVCAQTTVWTNYTGGNWSGQTAWGTNPPASPGDAYGGISGQGTGGPTYAIIFTNKTLETTAGPNGRSVQDIVHPPQHNFILNRLVFGIEATNVWLDLNATVNDLEFTNNGATSPTIAMSTTNPVLIYDASGLDQATILVDTNSLVMTGDGLGTLTIAVPINEAGGNLGTVSLTKNGAHTLVLGKPPGYSIGTFINNGMVIFTNAPSSAAPIGQSVTLSNDAGVWFMGLTAAQALSKLTTNSVGFLADDNPQGFDGTGFTSNLYVIASANTTYNGSYTPSAVRGYLFGALTNTTLTVSNALNDVGGATFLGVTGGPGNGGGGLTVISGNNGYTGGTFVKNNGVLYISADNSLGAADTSLQLSNGGILRVSANVTLGNRPVYVVAGDTSGGSGFQIDSGKILTIPGVLSGYPGGAYLSGSGMLVLQNPANVIGSSFIINGGSLNMYGSVLTNAVVQLQVDNGLSFSNATAFTIGGIASSNLVYSPTGPIQVSKVAIITWTNAAGAAITDLTLGNDQGAPAVFAGALTNIAITMRGLSQQILTGSNKFTTTPVISSGALGFGSTQSFGGQTSITLASPGALAFGWPIDQGALGFVASPGTANGTVALAVDSTNTLNLTALPNVYLGAVFSNIAYAGPRSNVLFNLSVLTPGANGYLFGGGGGTLMLSGATNSIARQFNSGENKLTGNRQVTVGNGFNGPVSRQIIAGNAFSGEITNIVVAPGGTLHITTNQNWTGGTVVTNGGNLVLDGIGGSAGASPITMVGGTLTMLYPGSGFNGPAMTNDITIPAGYTGTIVASSSGGLSNRIFGTPTSVMNYIARGNNGEFQPMVTNPAAFAVWADFKGRVNVLPATMGPTNNMRTHANFGLTNASVSMPRPFVAIEFVANPNSAAVGNNGVTNVIGELSGVSGTYLMGYSVTGRCVTWRIGDLNTSTTFAGGIISNSVQGQNANNNGQASFLKVGTGTFTLLGTNAANGINITAAQSTWMTAEGGGLVFGYNYAMDPRAVLNVQLPNGLTADPRGNGVVFSNDTVWTVGGLSGTGILTVASVQPNGSYASITLTAGANNANTTFGGNLYERPDATGTKLIKVGAGTLVLSGTNNYTGGTIIQQGILAFATNAALPLPVNVTVSNGAGVGLFLNNIQPILNSIGGQGLYGINVAINPAAAAESIDFVQAKITNATFLAAQTVQFMGDVNFFPDPATHVISLGAQSGATFWFTNVITTAKYGVGTIVSIDNQGGTVAFTDSNTTYVATNNYTGGTIVTSNTLYLAGDGSIGPGLLTLTTNTTLRLANAWSMLNLISMQTSGEFFQVDDGGWVRMTNAIAGVGPLRKTNNGILEMDATNTFSTGPMVLNNVTQQIAYTVSGGALLFGAPATISTAPPANSIVINAGGGIGFAVPADFTLLQTKIFRSDTSPGGVAVVLGQENAKFDFRSIGLQCMALTAVQDLTYSGAYIPLYLGTDVTGAFPWELAAISGVELDYVPGVTNVSGSSFLSVGGNSGGFPGTVKLLGDNTALDISSYDFGSGSAGTAQVIIAAGTLYITNDNALGRRGSSLGNNNPPNYPNPGPGDRAKCGLQFYSGGTLRTTNNILLDRQVWVNHSVDLGAFMFNVDPLSTLLMTNVTMYTLGPNNRGTITKNGAGMLWMTASNMQANLIIQRLDVNLNSGGLHADWGVAIPTNSFMTLFGSSGFDTWHEISTGYYTGQIANAIGGARLRNNTAKGWSAYGRDLSIRWQENINDMGVYNMGTQFLSGANSLVVTAGVWDPSGSVTFQANPFILNYSTATANLWFSNNVDLVGQSGLNGGGSRTLFVGATNPYVTKVTGYILNTTNTMGLQKTGIGKLVLEGTNFYNGSTMIRSGTLAIASLGSITNSESIVLGYSTNKTLISGFSTNSVRDNVPLAATFDVSGIGAGNPHRDATGRFMIGHYRPQTLAGFGTVIGSISMTNDAGAIFAPGDTNFTVITTNVVVFNAVTNYITTLPVAPSGGTLVFNNDLAFAGDANLYYDLGDVAASTNDLANVAGNLGLGGTVHVRALPGFPSSGGPYTYRLFNYSGGLGGTLSVDNPLPNAASGAVNTSVGGQVNLVVSFAAVGGFGAWQSFYFAGGSANPLAGWNADSYGKGMVNTNQYLAGLNPTNANSFLRITSIVPSNVANVTWNRITWKTSAGDPSAGANGWPTVITNIVQGSTGSNYVNAAGVYSNNFYDISTPLIIQSTGFLDPQAVTTNYVDQTGTNKYYRVRVPVP